MFSRKSIYREKIFLDYMRFQVLTAVSHLLMEEVRTSETSVYFHETRWRYILEGSKLYTSRRENLKSHISHSLKNGGEKLFYIL